MSLLLLCGIGFALASGVAYDIYADWIPQGKPLWSTLIENALPLLFALAVPYAAWLLSESERGAAYVSETTKWAVTGAGATLLVASVGVGQQLVQGELKPLIIVTQLTAAGTIAGLLIGYSVAEIRQAQAELKKRENQLSNIAENVSEGIFRYADREDEPDEPAPEDSDQDGEIIYANPAFARMLGYDSTKEVFQETLFDLFVRPVLRSEVIEQEGLADAADGLEIEIRTQEDHAYTGLLRCTRTESDYDDAVYYDGVISDITAQKNRQQELEETQEQYRTLVKQFPEGAVFLFDKTLTVRLTGGDELSDMGLTAREVEGSTPADLFPPDMADEMERRCREALGGTASRFEQAYDGRDYLVRALPVSEGDGGARRGMAVMVDITEQKQREREVERLNESLEKEVEKRTEQVKELSSALTEAEEKERTRLARLLHDDLQQTLYGAEMLLEKIYALREDGGDGAPAEEPELLGEVKAMIDQAIDTTRSLSADLSPPVLDDESLGEALNWLAGRMGRDYDLTVDVEADGAVPVPERNLRVLLFRLVRELLFNVVKHAGVDAATVRATRTDRSVRIVVADEGRGFDPDVLDVSDADGLGLASVHERLDGIGGQLDVDAAPGEGTTVTIRAPLSSKTMIWPTPDVPPSELG